MKETTLLYSYGDSPNTQYPEDIEIRYLATIYDVDNDKYKVKITGNIPTQWWIWEYSKQWEAEEKFNEIKDRWILDV